MSQKENKEVWIQVGPEGTTLRMSPESARSYFESQLPQQSQNLVPVSTGGKEGTTLLVEPSKVNSVQEQIQKRA